MADHQAQAGDVVTRWVKEQDEAGRRLYEWSKARNRLIPLIAEALDVAYAAGETAREKELGETIYKQADAINRLQHVNEKHVAEITALREDTAALQQRVAELEDLRRDDYESKRKRIAALEAQLAAVREALTRILAIVDDGNTHDATARVRVGRIADKALAAAPREG